MHLKPKAENDSNGGMHSFQNGLPNMEWEGNQQQVDTAVIIAAGKGSRLNGYQNGLPKPLVRVGGLPLIRRVILSAKRNGIRKFVIVVGYLADKIVSAVNAEQLGVQIRWVYNPDWQKQNGVSVLAAEPYVPERFFLFMSDHVFDKEILRQLSQLGMERSDRGILCVDYRISRIPDLDDATKVQAEGERLLNLGKGLTNFNAIDAGVFLCTRELFDALRASQAGGDDTLSGGIRMLAQQGKMEVMDIGEAFWQDVDTVPDLRHAEDLLLQATRSQTDGPIARNINRPISNRISRWLLKTPFTPGQISVFNLLLSIGSALLLSTGEALPVALGGVLFQLASILDGCDGEVAVIKMRDSRFGAMVDTITDQLSYVAFVAGVTIGAYRVTGNAAILAVSAGIFVLLMLAFAAGYVFIRRKNSGSFRELNRAIAALQHAPDQVWYLRLFSRISPIGRRDMFAFLSFLILLTGNVVWFYGVMTAAIFLMGMGISLSVLHLLSGPARWRPLQGLRNLLGAVFARLTTPVLPMEEPFEGKVLEEEPSPEKLTMDP